MKFFENWQAIFAKWAASTASSAGLVERARRPGPIRIIAVTRVLDEADIIESFIRHTACYVDRHLIVDNGSRDGTIEILKLLHDEGLPLKVYSNTSVSYVEQNSNGFLFEYAVKKFDADWVLFLDCDEFIDDRKLIGGLEALLRDSMREHHDRPCLAVPVFNYILTSVDMEEETISPIKMQHRMDKSFSSHVVLRADQYYKGAIIENGAHFVWIDGVKLEPYIEHGLAFAHYPERNAYQMLTKSVRGWAKVLAAGERIVQQGTSWHYKAPFETLRDCPEHLLRNADFLNFNKRSPEGLTRDPILYRGGALRYTKGIDYAMSAVRGLIGFIEGLSVRFGRISAEVPQAKKLNDTLDIRYAALFGQSRADMESAQNVS